MANDISGNPWYIDSTGTLIQQRFKFEGGTWNGAAAAATLELTDNVGRVVFKAVFPNDLVPVAIPKMGWINGLICTTISGGNVSLFVAMK